MIVNGKSGILSRGSRYTGDCRSFPIYCLFSLKVSFQKSFQFATDFGLRYLI